MPNKVYYENQSNWTPDDWYYLNRYLNRLFYYSSRKMEEIKSLDLSKMSIETKTIIRCILENQHKDHFIDELPNLNDLKDVGPLENAIYLEDPPSHYHQIYDKYNIMW